jgi:hypothetical protein
MNVEESMAAKPLKRPKIQNINQGFINKHALI